MIYYSDYLNLDSILNAQHPESDKHGKPAHDEMLFIITHQTFELWFKQVLFEIQSVIALLEQDYVRESDVSVCQARIRRVNRIMEHLCNQFTLIETMTPSEFMDFRSFLNPASGFQSVQWRMLELKLGLPDKSRVYGNYTDALSEPHKKDLDAFSHGSTLFTVIERWLENIPFMQTRGYAFWDEYKNAVLGMLDNDRIEVKKLAETEGHDAEKALAQIDANAEGFLSLFDNDKYNQLVSNGSRRLSQRATLSVLFISTYRGYPLLQLPYRFIDSIIELDKNVSLWRYRHALMVSRMIGMRVGTGGSSGHDYLLQTTIRQRVFDDITSLSSYLIPSHASPKLPDEIAERLQFVNEAR